MTELYDLTRVDFPLDRGFATVQVYTCSVCGAKNNFAYWGNYRFGGARLDCHYEDEEWHRRLSGLRRRACEQHPKRYHSELAQDVKTILTEADPDNRFRGNPDISWSMERTIFSGFLVEGVICRPGEFFLKSALLVPFTPFVEEVFQEVYRDCPKELIEYFRSKILRENLFVETAGRLPRTEASFESALKEVEAKYPVPWDDNVFHIKDPYEKKYRDAYMHWAAIQHLVKNGRRAAAKADDHS